MDGWIKLHRKVLDNPVVCKDSDYAAVWMYLLLNATHKEYPVMFSGEKILLQPGQLITGRKVISEKFNISESKVQRILKTFEIEQQIEQQNSNKNRVVSILSWSDYQHDEQQNEQLVNNKRTTTEQQVNTNKNVKNVEEQKNDKKGNKPPRNKKTYPEDSSEYKMALYLHSKIMEHAEASGVGHLVKKANLQNWADDCRKLMEIDKVEKALIKSVIDWATSHSFWKDNILSASTLRDKFQNLAIQMKSDKKGATSNERNGQGNSADTGSAPKQSLTEMFTKR